MKSKIDIRQIMKKTLIIGGWLLLWQLAAFWVHNPILLVGPVEVIREICSGILNANFRISIAGSFTRIMGGFLVAFFTAVTLAVISYRQSLAEEVLAPLVSVIKTVPVAVVVVLVLIWAGAGNLSFYVTFMVVFPNVYANVIQGLKETEEDLLEMAEVYHLVPMKKIRYIYLPSIMPYLISSVNVCVGMSFKSGVAAELIGLPLHSIGEKLYQDKIYLNTAGVFAWAIVIIVISSVTEKIVLSLLRYIHRQSTKSMGRKKMRTGKIENGHYTVKNGLGLSLESVSKNYSDKTILQDFSYVFEPGQIYGVMGESGRGKTTLLRICAGLEEIQEGKLCFRSLSMSEDRKEESRKVAMMFQEDRLLSQCNAVTNVLLTCDTLYQSEEVKDILCELLPMDSLEQPVAELSGGMKRRVAVARALLSSSDLLILDEPFTGLDEETRTKVREWILRYRKGRTMLIATHEKEDLEYFNATILNL